MSAKMSVMRGLGWTFDTQAERYQRMRPGYVPELFEESCRHGQLGDVSTAVEVGVDGGQAREPILQTGCHVAAAESGA